MSVSLRNATAGLDDFVTGTEVTIDTADLPAAVTANANGGWIFFKLAAPVLLLAATNYNIQAKTSSVGQVSLFRDGTTDNISRCLRTTTNAAPGAGDDLIVVGEYTGAGTSNSFTVTMQNEATTDFGSNTTTPVTPALAIGSKGVLTWGTTASTNYYLKLSGHAVQYLDSTYNMGTTGTPMPSTSTGVLEFDPAADGDMGFVIRGGTNNAQGASKTNKTMLTADAAAAATAITVGTTTGWLATDVLAFASTTRTATESEIKIISTVDSATAVTLTAGLTNAHSGTAPIAGEVINITNNLKIRSATSTIMAYVLFGGTATMAPTVDWDYVEIYYVGENAAGKRGVEVTISGTSVSLANSAIHDCEDGGLTFITSGTPTFSNLVLYNINSASTVANGINIATGATLATSTAITIGTNANNLHGLSMASVAASVTDCTIVSCSTSSGGNAGFGTATLNAPFTGTFSGNISHSNNTRGFLMGNGSLFTITLTNCTAWRNNNTGGLEIGNNVYLTLVGFTAFGNNGYGVGGSTSVTQNVGNVVLRSCTIYGGTTLVQTNGILVIINVTACGNIYIFDSTFGTPSAHSTSDISSSDSNVYLFNTTLASSTEISTPASSFTSIQSHKNDGSSTTFKTVQRFGTIQNDTTTRHTASGYSWQMTPNNATNKMNLPGPTTFDTFKVAVNASTLVTITGYVLYDGSYNGNMPRLVVVGGIVGGVGSAGTDVTDSATTSNANNWDQLSVSFTPSEAGVVEWFIDGDGTAGSFYFQDVVITQA